MVMVTNARTVNARMTTGTQTVDRLDREQLLDELRTVNHWRRLRNARLDLAVAALVHLDEPPMRRLEHAPTLPALHDLIGLPSGATTPGAEISTIESLHAALDDLDCYALALRSLALSVH